MSDDALPYELGVLEDARNYRRELLRRFDPFLGPRILEIGGGTGLFSAMLAERAETEDLCVVEPDPVCRSVLKRRAVNAEVFSGTAAMLPAGYSCSSIVSSNVLEHIEDDTAEVSCYLNLLEPGGYFCLFVPAREELYALIDKQFGHFRRYTRTGLRRLLVDAGFEIESIRYFNLPGYFLWWFSFVVLKSTRFNPLMVKLYDRMAFPMIAWAERTIAAPPFGQNLLVIARKPEIQETECSIASE